MKRLDVGSASFSERLQRCAVRCDSSGSNGETTPDREDLPQTAEGPRSRTNSGAQRPPATTTTCHRQRGILKQRAQLEIDGRTIQAETKTAVLQLHDAAIQQLFWWCLWQWCPHNHDHNLCTNHYNPKLRSSIESLAFRLSISFFSSILSPSKSIDPTSTPILNNSFQFV